MKPDAALENMLSRIQACTEKLHKAGDRANEEIGELEDRLNQAGACFSVGVSVVKPYSGIVGWGKVDGAWGFVWTADQSVGPIKLLRASLTVRIGALPHLRRVVDELVLHAERVIETIEGVRPCS